MKVRLLLAFLVCISTGSGQVPQPDPGPVQAELLANLDVRRAVSGKTVFARVTQDWKWQDCTLRTGAIVEGTVEESVARVGKSESKLALSFNRAQCDGREMQPMDLVLTVIARPPVDWSKVPEAQFTMSMDLPTPRAIVPSQSELRTGTPPPTMASGQNKSFENFTYTRLALTQLQLSGIEHRFPARKNIRAGDVLEIKDLRLDVGTGPHRSTVVSSKTRNVYLEEFTQILLAPPGRVFRFSESPAEAGPAEPYAVGSRISSLPPSTAAPPTLNDIGVCAPPGCAVDLPVTEKDLRGPSGTSISTRALGYARRARQVHGAFGDEESLAWLGPGQLVFAFNPHKLIPRSGADQGGALRVIRAVLVDTVTRNVVRAVDWEIADLHRFMWQLDGDRILVHVGKELRVYRAGLEVERRVPLVGPLVFVRIAPGGRLLAIATLRERHSPELHAKLRSELGREPEEDVDVAILDEEFKTVASASTLSNLMPPTLLDEGQVRLQAEPGQWYRLAMHTWENQRSGLVRFHSFCMPEVTSTAPDLLFLLTCDAANGDMAYSVLRHDGKVLLRGVSNPQELGHEAIGNYKSRRFAVKIVHAERPILSPSTFRNSDLDSEEVRVYRADDGKRLLAVRVGEPIASRGGYALSPDGTRLAVLTGSEIQFFPVPAE